MVRALPALSPAIRDYYLRTDEKSRLEESAFLLEGLRTRELITRYLQPPPAVLLDVGGAAGAYAFWLAEAGYTVHLIDPIERHIAEATQQNSGSPLPLASCQTGDARSLAFEDESADAVLLLGPLYHLTAAEDRALAIAEARRVMKQGGVLFASAISRGASVLDGLARHLFDDPEFHAIAKRDLQDGQHRNLSGKLDYFTTAYFHTPDELHAELQKYGLSVEGLFGIEGPGWMLPDLSARLTDPQHRANLLLAARLVEQLPSVLGASAHLLAVARKDN